MNNMENGIEWTRESLEELVAFVRENDQLGRELAVQQFILRKMQPPYPEGILKFDNGDSEYLLQIGKNNRDSYGAWVKFHLDKNHKIWSVQNGNEVLTVGDNVKYKYSLPKIWKIARFIISTKNELLAQSEGEANVEQVADLVKAEEKMISLSDARERVTKVAREIWNDTIFFKIMDEFKD